MTNPAIGILMVDSGTGPIPLCIAMDVRPGGSRKPHLRLLSRVKHSCRFLLPHSEVLPKENSETRFAFQ